MRSAIIAVLLVTGCAAPAARVDVISFDRGAFGYTFGSVAQTLRTACAMKKLAATDCARLEEIEQSVVKQLTTPPPAAAASSVDMDALLRMMMTLGKMAL